MRRIVVIVLVLTLFVGGVLVICRLMNQPEASDHVLNEIVSITPPPIMPSPAPAPQTPVPKTAPWPYGLPPEPDDWGKLDADQRLADARKRLQPRLDSELSSRGLELGDDAFVRIFKQTNELELWLRPRQHDGFRLYRTYDTVRFSGTLGPKTKEGDMQAPEGFYSVTKSQLNPASSYHLAFNVGYPNAYDRSLNRTGSLIMVHGSDVSVGCFAMTDPVIEEIYLVVEAALNKGRPTVPVHVFPFRMTEERMTQARHAQDQWFDFWSNIKEGYDAFEAEKQVPRVSARDGSYVIIP